jgi:hypothetical protein
VRCEMKEWWNAVGFFGRESRESSLLYVSYDERKTLKSLTVSVSSVSFRTSLDVGDAGDDCVR